MFNSQTGTLFFSKLSITMAFAASSIICLAQDSETTDGIAPSAAAPAASEKPLYANNAERDNALITKAFANIAKDDEVQLLETPDEKIVALYKAGETRTQKGTLLILHSPEIPQTWPSSLEMLRRNLPVHGWATMALPLPPKYPGQVPARDTVVTANKSSESPKETEQTPDPAAQQAVSAAETPLELAPVVAREKRITQRVESAFSHLTKLGERKIVIMVDNSSAPAALAELYAKVGKTDKPDDAVEGPIQALILVNLQNQEPLSKQQLSDIFSISNLPVMDVFFAADDAIQRDVRRVHRAEAMRKNVRDYQQLVLPMQTSSGLEDDKNFWLAKVQGFASAKVGGSEPSGNKPPSNNLGMK